MSSPRSPRRALIWQAALVAVAFGLLAFSISQNWKEIRNVFKREVDYRLFLGGFAIYLISLMMTFVRWHTLVRAQGLTFSIRDAVKLGFIGNVFNLVIPGAVGGDVIKAAFLCRMHPDQKPRAVASMVLDRVLGLLGLFMLAGIAGLAFWRSADPQVRVLIGIVWGATAAGLLGLTVVFSPNLYRPLNKLVAGRGKVETLVRELEAIGLAYRRKLGTVAAMLGLATFVHGLYVLAFFAASSAIFDAVPSLLEHYLMVPLTLFSTAVPLPFGALGFTESVSGRLFAMVHHTDGAVAMMAFRVVMYASGALSACIYLANLRQVRDLKQDAEFIVVEAVEETVVATDLN